MRQHIRIALEGVRQTLAAQGFTKTLAAMYRTDPLSAEIVFRDELFQMGREVLGDTFEIMDDFGPSVEVEEEKYIKLGNYMRKCASGGQRLANAERGVGMIGFAGEIDTEFFITNVLLCKIIGNPGPNILVAHFRM